MTMRRHWPWLIACLLFACPALFAQDDQPMTPLSIAGFDNTGSITVGDRIDQIRGYQPMFLEMFNLQPGFRLMDFSLFGQAQPGKSTFADSYSVLLSGIGGDPYPTAQVKIAKHNVYDFRVDWRQSHYYWLQNNDVVLPIAGPAHLSTGLTDNHDWDTVRGFGSVDLTLYATRRLRFNIDYYRTTDQGNIFTTRSLDFFDSPGFWGGLARGNAYDLFAPLNDITNRITGGADYTYNSWSFHYKAGYQTFTENTNLNNLTSPEGGIDGLIAPTTNPLTAFSESTMRQLSTPVSEFSFAAKPFDDLEWRGNYIYYHYDGPASLDESFNGLAPSSGGVANTPYSVSQALRANVAELDNIIGQGLTYHVTKWFDVDADYRYTRFSTNSVGTFESLFTQSGTSTQSGGNTTTVWRDGLSDFDLRFSFRPTNNLLIEPGVHLMKADVEALEDGVVDPAQTLRTKTVWPEFSFWYQPIKKLSFRGDYQSFTNSASYTAITPHTQVGGHAILRYQPIEKLSIENDLNVMSSQLLDSSFQQNLRSDAIVISYAYDPRFSIFAGLSYGAFLATGDIDYARGTAPLTEFLRDQEVNRVWQGGVEVKPYKRFGARFTMDYVRSTGLGQIGSEPPAYGPLTFPLGTVTAFFDFPKAGRLSLNLQRTTYKEQIVPVNNFSANLLMILWTRNF